MSFPGNLEFARVINVTVEALLASYHPEARSGAGSGGLAADAYGESAHSSSSSLLPAY